MGFLGSLILYILMLVGFILAAWVTNGVFNTFRKKDEQGPFDAIGALVLWCSLFGGYGYVVSSLFQG